jgi:hypothetical protein
VTAPGHPDLSSGGLLGAGRLQGKATPTDAGVLLDRFMHLPIGLGGLTGQHDADNSSSQNTNQREFGMARSDSDGYRQQTAPLRRSMRRARVS